MHNYNISSDDFKLEMVNVEAKARPMSINGCKSVRNQRLDFLESKMETLEKVDAMRQHEIENMRKEEKLKQDEMAERDAKIEALQKTVLELQTVIASTPMKPIENERSMYD